MSPLHAPFYSSVSEKWKMNADATKAENQCSDGAH